MSKPKHAGLRVLEAAAKNVPISNVKLRQILNLKESMERFTAPDQQAVFDELEAKLQEQAAAGKPASAKNLEIVTKMLIRQREIIPSVPDSVPRGLLLFVVQEFLEDLERYPTQEQLFKTAGLSSFVEALILSCTLRTYPVWPGR
jgi:hypothetical protein